MSKLSGEISLSASDDELRKRFMDPCRLGSEAEWWARRRIEELERQLADLTTERDTFYMNYRMGCDKETKALEQQLAESKEEYGRACHLVAQMHAAAVGEVTGPKLGVVEDVAEVRRQLDTAWAQAHRLAHALECLIMDTKDNAIVSKWWDSAFEAMEEYHKLKPGADEDAEAWVKIRKAGI